MSAYNEAASISQATTRETPALGNMSPNSTPDLCRKLKRYGTSYWCVPLNMRTLPMEVVCRYIAITDMKIAP